MSATTKGKQGTRGQKQIYEENQETLRYYFLAAALVSPLVACAYFFFFDPIGAGFWVCF